MLQHGIEEKYIYKKYIYIYIYIYILSLLLVYILFRLFSVFFMTPPSGFMVVHYPHTFVHFYARFIPEFRVLLY